ncbi:MAG: hypothetical protein JSR57_07000, partial [Verrucomicrobia bacterium]|nr:hypothetical protein [Verrucomicrobiota bacterium]
MAYGDFSSPVDMNPSYSVYMGGNGGNEIGSWERPVEGADKKSQVSVVTPQVKQSKATVFMRNVALAIARKIDRVWDRMNPGHQGSAINLVNDIFHNPTISAPRENDRMAPAVYVHARREQVQALFTLRSEILQLGSENGNEAEIESKVQEYDALLATVGGTKGEFYRQVNNLGESIMNEYAAKQKEKNKNLPNEADQQPAYNFDPEMEALKAMLTDPTNRFIDGKVSGERVESDKPYIDDHFEIESDPWNWQVPNTAGRSVRAAMDELLQRTKTVEEGGRGLVPNFRIAANETEVKRWMVECPTNFSNASDEDLTNYIKRRLGADGVFASGMSRQQMQEFNERAANLSPEDKTKLVHDIRECLLKDRTGKISQQVSEFVKLIGLLYKKTDGDVTSSNNTQSFLVALAGPFTAKVQEVENLEGKSNMLPIQTEELIAFICENYEQIL